MAQRLNLDTEYRLSCRKFLENLLARRDFSEACRYFDSIEGIAHGESDPHGGAILRLGAVAFGQTGNLSKALTLIRTAIDFISRIADETIELAEGYIVLGNILRDLGKFQEAEKAYRDAESIARRHDDYSTAGVALNRMAAIHFRRGELDGSLKCLLEAVNYANRENDKQKIAYLFGNIGRVYSSMGKLGDAKENIRMNIELSENLGDEVEAGRAYLSLGYINIQQEKFDEAESALQTGLEYIKRNNMAKEEIIHLTYCGELMYKIGQLDTAEQLLTEAATKAGRFAPESLLAARPLRHLAELQLRRKNFRRALQLTSKTLVLMKNLDNRVEIGALLRIKAVCLEQLKQNDKATRFFSDSIRMLEECKAKSELAETLAEAGRSMLFSSSRRTMYLCRAEEVYNYCGVEPKVVRIQKLIGQMEPDSEPTTTALKNPDNTTIDVSSRNEKMKKIVAHLQLLRGTDMPILLTGETGTGKDYMANYLHSIARPEGPFIAVNCAAVPEALMESELFGYRKGAFTGADSNRRGLFLAADKGVLLLDEIGELPLLLQTKLLSVLETRKIRPLGSSTEIDLDIMVIAATNRNLYKMVDDGTFRRDLYYRLACISLEIPPLRERKEDIPCLLNKFMRMYGLIKNGDQPDPELVRQFVSYDWPGNIRQMENKIKQLAVMASLARDGSMVELSRSFFDDKKEEVSNSLSEQVERFEKRLLLEALVSSGGNKSEAARLLSIHESTFRAKMKRYGLEAMAN